MGITACHRKIVVLVKATVSALSMWNPFVERLSSCWQCIQAALVGERVIHCAPGVEEVHVFPFGGTCWSECERGSLMMLFSLKAVQTNCSSVGTFYSGSFLWYDSVSIRFMCPFTLEVEEVQLGFESRPPSLAQFKDADSFGTQSWNNTTRCCSHDLTYKYVDYCNYITYGGCRQIGMAID